MSEPRAHIFVQQLWLGAAGPTVGIKDSIDIAGFRTQLGSRAFADAPVAAQHAEVVRLLLDGGCRIVGKTVLHELAYGVTGINPWSGTPLNVRFPDLVPGGSSSGSAAAVAANLVDFAIGTDTGGSIRVPAACCGIYGLKPTYGSVSRDGVTPARSSLDCVGPLARDLATIETAMTLLSPVFQSAPAPSTATVGRVAVAAAPAIDAALCTALGREELTVSAVELPSLEAAFDAGLAVIGAETWAAFGHLVEHEGLGPDVRARLLAARGISAATLAGAEACRRRFQAEVDAALAHCDVLALPTLPDVPLTLAVAAAGGNALRMTALVRPFNLSGHPALTLPLTTTAGLPAGLQLVGRRGADAGLCAVAHLVEAPRVSA